MCVNESGRDKKDREGERESVRELREKELVRELRALSFASVQASQK